MTEQFYNQLLELYERRDVPPQIKRRIELVLNEYDRLNETRLNPLPTSKHIPKPPLTWASPPIAPAPKLETTSHVDINVDEITKLDSSMRLNLIENNISQQKGHLDALSEPITFKEFDHWLERDVVEAIRQSEDQRLNIGYNIYHELPVDLSSEVKLNEYVGNKVDLPPIHTVNASVDKVKNEIDIDLSELLHMSLSANEIEPLDIKPINNFDGSQIARISHIPTLRKSWKGVSRVREIDIGEIVKRVGYIQRSVNRSIKLAPLDKVQNKMRSVLGYMPHIPKYESTDLVVTKDIYMYVNLRDVFLKHADDILAAQHRTSAEIDAWDVYVVQNWQDADLFHDFVLDHYAPSFSAFNSLERLIVNEFIAKQWQIYSEHARTARQEVLGMNLTPEQIKNLPSNPDHAWVSGNDLNLPTKK